MEAVQAGEALSTLRAEVGALPQVYSLVLNEAVFIPEALSALSAGMGCLNPVGPSVHCEALATLIHWLPSVHAVLLAHISLCLGSFPEHRTLLGFDCSLSALHEGLASGWRQLQVCRPFLRRLLLSSALFPGTCWVAKGENISTPLF